MRKDLDDQPLDPGKSPAAMQAGVDAPSRRRLLQLGAVGIPLVLTPKTGLAQTMASVNCSVILNPADRNYGLNPGDADYLQDPGLPLVEKVLAPEQLNNGSFVGDVSDPDYNGAYLRYLNDMIEGDERIDTASCLASVMTVHQRPI